MTRATLLAAVAGVVAAPGVVDLVAGVRLPRRSPRGVGVGLLAALGRGLGVRAPRRLGERIVASGLELAQRDFMAVKGGAALAGGAVAVAALPIAPGRLGPALLAALPAVAFVAPDLWLHRRTDVRRRVIEAELADVLDLLRVAVAAGLTPSRALGEVGARHPGLLPAELRRTADRMRYGVPRASAYDDLEGRCPAPGVAALVAALRRADRHGAPLAAALSADARTARARQAQRTTEAAARAAPQIQLVVALLLVPAVLLLVAAALVPAIVPLE